MVFVDDPAGHRWSTTADARHLLDVLRLRPGEPVIASDGAGAWVPCRVGPAAAGRAPVGRPDRRPGARRRARDGDRRSTRR